MSTALLLGALLTGLAGGPHCVAMCGSIVQPLMHPPHDPAQAQAGAPAAPRWPTSAAWRRDLALLAGRMSAYAALGAVAASFMALLAALGRNVSALHPLWTMAQVAVLLLGLSLLIQARQPRIVDAWAARLAQAVRRWREQRRSTPRPAPALAVPGGWQTLRFAAARSVAGNAADPGSAAAPACARRASVGLGARGAFALGASLALLPCGLLYSALAVAALASSAWAGALAMLAFALGSSLSFAFWQWLWRKSAVSAMAGSGSPRDLQARFGIRLAGAALVAMAIFALAGHDMKRIAEWCGVPL